MFSREEIQRILAQAREIDSGLNLFGTKHHQYRLEPPVPEEFVRDVEEKCGFTLPVDYRRFITEVGDGGAGPSYGIVPFGGFWKRGYFQENRFAEQRRERWRHSLARPFSVRPMQPEDPDNYGICGPKDYEKSPESYFVWVKPEDEQEERWPCDGYFGLGDIGCGWGYGVVLNGKHRGRIFTTDHEKGFALDADSFDAFYSGWLAKLADTEVLRREVELWKGRFIR